MARAGDTQIVFDKAFFDTAMKQPGVRKLQDEVASKALAAARASAPVDTGDYRKSLRKVWRRGEYRDAILVEGTDEKTLLIESRTGNLARALKRARS